MAVQEEGSVLTARPALNFIGSGVSATDDAANNRTNVTVAGGSGGGIALGLRSALPVSPGAAGSAFKCTDGPFVFISDGTAWKAFVFGYPVVEPILANYGWVNQGVATVSGAGGGVTLASMGNVGDNNRILKLTAPGVPYTLTIAFAAQMVGYNYMGAGLCLRESSTGKFVAFKFGMNNGAQLLTETWANPTSFNAAVQNNPMAIGFGPMLWLQVKDDGTNRLFNYSFDGVYFSLFRSEPRNTYMVPNELGVVMHAALGVPLLFAMHVNHWQVTTP